VDKRNLVALGVVGINLRVKEAVPQPLEAPHTTGTTWIPLEIPLGYHCDTTGYHWGITGTSDTAGAPPV